MKRPLLIGAILLLLTTLMILPISVSADVNNVETMVTSDGWVAACDVYNVKGFTGQMAHAHIKDPGDIDEILTTVLSAGGTILGVAGFVFPPAGVAGIVAAASAQIGGEFTKNSDGTYDLFIFSGDIDVAGITKRPFVWYGFSSDQWWEPPVGVSLSIIKLPGIDDWSAADLTGYFRDYPKP